MTTPTSRTTSARRLHDPQARGFASDNYAGVHPEVLEAIALANGGHQVSYGADAYTEHLQDVFRGHFGGHATAYPVFNGTGANVVALQAVTERWQSVICAASAHIHVDECGAPEKMGGLKLLPVGAPLGTLTLDAIDTQAYGFDDQHRAQPGVVSITQSTELGTLYSVEEIAEIVEHAHTLGMAVHLDGARIANAAAALDRPLRDFTTDVGVDIVSFGGTKNGLMLGEAVVVLNPDAVRGMDYLRKSSMQLASKMRFLSAQFDALLSGDLWLRNARHANAMAQRLETAVRAIPGVQVLRPVQANAVFAVLPQDVTARLQKLYPFYVWDESTGEVRWMTSFDTTEADVDSFAAALRAELVAD
ncbi:threonine aldolase family protein [Pedococcus sp. 5OH_020]|uniref:threonine aldolase family protein n=1 Tax=Pedococcus sp. 5OH_020 TaxID=2989814 RepID=UPI0022E9E2A1|nr:low specificity L-threonine aldolase [Pedococcus sp. 5OH_020]